MRVVCEMPNKYMQRKQFPCSSGKPSWKKHGRASKYSDKVTEKEVRVVKMAGLILVVTIVVTVWVNAM